jgi:hypothetical protein
MVKTQVYLREEELAELHKLARRHFATAGYRLV